MKLGNYTFAVNPDQPVPLPRAERMISWEENHKGVSVLDWGEKIGGVVIPMDWKYIPTTQFDTLDAMYLAGDLQPWDPEDSSGRTFEVKITKCTASYGRLLGGANSERRDGRLELLIMWEL